ncbi:DUF4275 family protein [Planomicrobium sp. YIM 101495]|uniref:DUF4275 family protein n=1 Tax=Planomicrobium sp. YIM 101495 TaxID=2665160 RepID=UPI0012B93D89|nr:DUF4275 family protein [Planomicrobium sp. YIM 101495]MTD31260.1 DUF4275 family protein [Planomicrobium sp. YIM 101495]
MKLEKRPGAGKALRKRWEKAFAGHLTRREKKGIHLDSYLWHLCSWEATEFAEGEEAVRLFERRKKRGCFIFFEGVADAFWLADAKDLRVSDLPHDRKDLDSSDLYAMDETERWTFMMTHEREHGPYWIENSAPEE